MRPFYEQKSLWAQQWISEFFNDELDYHVHVSEGSLFMVVVSRHEDLGGDALCALEGSRRARDPRTLLRSGRGQVGATAKMHPLYFAMDEGAVCEGIAILGRGGHQGYIFEYFEEESRADFPQFRPRRPSGK